MDKTYNVEIAVTGEANAANIKGKITAKNRRDAKAQIEAMMHMLEDATGDYYFELA